MWTLLKRINQNLVTAIPVMMALGFGYGILCDPALLKRLIVPLTFLMVYPMMVTLNLRRVFSGGDGRAQLLSQAINFAIIPFLAYGAGRLFFPQQPYMALGLLLAGLVPTSGMTISWTGFAGGNTAAAVKMTVIGLSLGSIATPFYVKFLLGTAIAVDLLAVGQQILVIVFLPMALGFATRQALIRRFGQQGFQTRLAPRFPGLSTLGVLGIVFVAMALKARAIAGAPDLLLAILAPLALVYAANYLLSTFLGRLLLPREDAIAMVYGTVMRNLSIALAIAINAFGPQGSTAALVVAMAYVIQVQSAAWYVKFTDRIYGARAVAAAV
ncbi:MAG: bile acid:sodium symporter [Desulfobacteraceae bacterium]|nr:bile acid:sodium symporter [Desulfobacteraceae bacterium]